HALRAVWPTTRPWRVLSIAPTRGSCIGQARDGPCAHADAELQWPTQLCGEGFRRCVGGVSNFPRVFHGFGKDFQERKVFSDTLRVDTTDKSVLVEHHHCIGAIDTRSGRFVCLEGVVEIEDSQRSGTIAQQIVEGADKTGGVAALRGVGIW